jgi:hypothetical protein
MREEKTVRVAFLLNKSKPARGRGSSCIPGVEQSGATLARGGEIEAQRGFVSGERHDVEYREVFIVVPGGAQTGIGAAASDRESREPLGPGAALEVHAFLQGHTRCPLQRTECGQTAEELPREDLEFLALDAVAGRVECCDRTCGCLGCLEVLHDRLHAAAGTLLELPAHLLRSAIEQVQIRDDHEQQREPHGRRQDPGPAACGPEPLQVPGQRERADDEDGGQVTHPPRTEGQPNIRRGSQTQGPECAGAEACGEETGARGRQHQTSECLGRFEQVEIRNAASGQHDADDGSDRRDRRHDSDDASEVRHTRVRRGRQNPEGPECKVAEPDARPQPRSEDQQCGKGNATGQANGRELGSRKLQQAADEAHGEVVHASSATACARERKLR